MERNFFMSFISCRPVKNKRSFVVGLIPILVIPLASGDFSTIHEAEFAVYQLSDRL